MAAGKEIKRLRGNMSAQEAATLIGVDVDRLRKWEQRDVDPKDSGDILRVENFFGLPISDLPKLDNFQWTSKSGSKTNVDTVHSLSESNRILAEANKILAEAHDRIARGNEKLINLLELSYHKPSSADPALLHPEEPVKTSAEKELLQTGHTGPYENRRKRGPGDSSKKKGK